VSIPECIIRRIVEWELVLVSDHSARYGFYQEKSHTSREINETEDSQSDCIKKLGAGCGGGRGVAGIRVDALVGSHSLSIEDRAMWFEPEYGDTGSYSGPEVRLEETWLQGSSPDFSSPRTPFMEHGRRIEPSVRNSGDLSSCHTVTIPAQTPEGALQKSC